MGSPVLTKPLHHTAVNKKNGPYRTLSGLTPYSGIWTVNQIAHLLKRTMFGASVADINYFKTKTVSQSVDELVNNSFAPATQPVNDYNDDMYTDPMVAAGQTWIYAANLEGGDDFRRIYSFKKWQMGQMIKQGRSVQMKMTLFWHNHFATHIGDLGGAKRFYNHHMLFRNNATGNFKALAKSISIDCIMLQYLNGEYNSKWAPNENYARELQELFCIGKGPDSHYSEDDVKAAARVLTGWQINYDTNTPYFLLDDHDTDDKSFSSFYNYTTITGRNNNNAGNTELDDLLTMLFSTNECALFLCRKLYRWFVYYDIDAATEANVIVPLADILRNNNYELKPVLKALFKSEHFFDVLNVGAQIKSPVDFTIGLLRSFNVAFPAAADYASNYKHWEIIWYFNAIMNQDFGDPPNVAGWAAYYQTPQYYDIWINASTYPKRVDFSKWMVEYGIDANNTNIHIDVIEFAKLLSSPFNPNIVVSESLDILYSITISQASKDALKTNTLLDGQATDAYWTSAWLTYMADPANDVNRSIVETRLKNLYRFIVNSPEYQLA